MTTDILMKLEQYEQVRCEWKYEPESWICEIQKTPSLTNTILTECKLGLWGKRSNNPILV